jgi:ankyrin repeat protein
MSLEEFFEAIKKGDVQTVKSLIDTGVSLSGTDDKKNTALHIAADSGNLEIVTLLVDKGSPIDYLNMIDVTPIALAARNGHLEVVKYLCDRGATLHAPDIAPTPLQEAACMGHFEIVRYLVEQMQVPVNYRGRPFGETPLFGAASFGQLEIVRYLMGRGADPNLATSAGETPIARVQETIRLAKKQGLPPAVIKSLDVLLGCLHGINTNSKDLE